MNKLLTSLLFLLAVTSLAFNVQAEEESKSSGPVEGIHYTRIEPAQPTSVPDGKVEVAEFFWYGCPHCYRFEPYIKGWLKHKDDNIVFTRIPAALNAKWETHARFYYAAESLGELEKVHEPLFIALHEKKEPIYKEEDLLDFAETRGVDRDKLAEAMKSFSVSSKIQKSRKLAEAYNLDGVPTVIINGKYKTSSSSAGSNRGAVYLMHYLSMKELQEIQAESKE